MPRLTQEELSEIRKLASADFNGHLVIRLLDEYEKLIDPSKLEDAPPVDLHQAIPPLHYETPAQHARIIGEMERYYRGDGWKP